MSRKATPIKNAAMEPYFLTFKAEAIHSKQFKNQNEATTVSNKYIAFYNQ